MNIVAQGRRASLVYTPWFNRILLGGFFLFSAGAAIWIAFAVQGQEGAWADLMRTFQTANLLIAGAALLGLIFSPSRAYVFDKGQGRGVFYVQRKFVFGTFQKPRLLSELSHAEADRVKGNGPEAYWLRLVTKTGKKIKLGPVAFTPEKAKAALAVIKVALAGQGGGTSSPQMSRRPVRKGFGRAA
ncbi:MAG: hypothetical protein AAGB16_07365 [Pseudomonadota bacterium]